MSSVPLEPELTFAERWARGDRSLSARVGRMVPRGIGGALWRTREGLRLARESVYDTRLYARNASLLRRAGDTSKLRGLMTQAYHSFEKGLSLPERRPGFGQDRLPVLLSRIERYVDAVGPDHYSGAPTAALAEYLAFNRFEEVDLGPAAERIAALVELHRSADAFDEAQGGTLWQARDEVVELARRDLGPFFLSRHSVRTFTDEAVDEDLIRTAVSYAQRSPCVCNRQSSMVRALTAPGDVDRALEIQGGARGFGQGVPCVLIISTDLTYFQGIGERYQAWIDGGMFAMTLMWGLHSLGLGSCALNWSKGHTTDLALKEAFEIPESERVIMLMATGHPAEAYRVARSARRPMDDVLTFVSPCATDAS